MAATFDVQELDGRPCGVGGQRRGRAWMGAVAAFVLAVAFLVFASGARAESLSAAEEAKLPQITEWVYYNSGLKPSACGEVCMKLWSAEHGAMPNSGSAQEILEALTAFEISDGLWPSMEELQILIAGRNLETAEQHQGLDIHGRIYIALNIPAAPSDFAAGCLEAYKAGLHLAGSLFTPSEGEPVPRFPVNSWLAWNPCVHAAGETLTTPWMPDAVEKCPYPTAESPAFWETTVYLLGSDSCGPGFYEPRRPIYAAVSTLPVRFGRPEAFTGQESLYWSGGEKDPGTEATEHALKKLLEQGGPFNAWVGNQTTGEGSNPTGGPSGEEEYGGSNPGGNHKDPCAGKPVNCATGNEFTTQADLTVGGRGVPLTFSRTYNSQAGAAGTTGMFGYGWSSSFSDHLNINATAGTVAVVQSNGSVANYTGSLSSYGAFAHPAWIEATLIRKTDGTFLYTLPDQEVFHFDSTGKLLSEADRNENTTTMTYGGTGHLEGVTDSTGRKLTLAYNSEGHVESIKDPMGHVIKYEYTAGGLSSVIAPGESAARWQFKYDTSHQLTEQADGRGGKTVNEYNSSHQVTTQTDPLGSKLTFEYRTATEPYETTTTNHTTGAVTKEQFNGAHEMTTITRGAGTSATMTERFEYNSAAEITAATNGADQTSVYTYSTAGDKTSARDPAGVESKWAYNSTHDVVSSSAPGGETTTIKRDSHGNVESASRPAPGEATQTTKYAYDAHGDLESTTDPLGHTTKYEYDSSGDRTVEVDPEGDKRTWTYNANSQETGTTSPRGNVTGGEPAEFTTTIERDAQGRATTVSEPAAAGLGKPISRVAASANGIAQEGRTVSAARGIWTGTPTLSYAYQWQHCNSTGGSCTSISGATSATYALTHPDVGYTIRVVVTATNSSGSASSTSTATATVSVSVISYASRFGSSGSGVGQFGAPKGIALDGKGDVVIADEGNSRVAVFKENGEFLKTFGSYGSGAGQFGEIKGLTIDPKGNIWVADQGNSRIAEFNEKDEYVKTIGTAGTAGGQLKEAKGVAADAHSNIWVADTGNNRIQKFNEKGEFVATYGFGVSNGEEKLEACTTSCRAGNPGAGHGQFEKPRTLATDSAGNVWVTDTGNNRVEELNEKGEYVKVFGTAGTGNGQFNEPVGITIDSHSNTWVTDATNNRVEEFNEKGEYATQFGTTGSENGQFHEPWSIQVNTRNEIFVSDSANTRIQKLAPTTVEVPQTPTYASRFGSSGSGVGQFGAPKGIALDGKGDVVIADEGNSRVAVFKENGEFLKTFGSYGSGAGQFGEIKGLTIDPKGNIWVADQGNSRIAEFNEKDEYVKTIGTAGTAGGQLKEAKGVAADAHSNIWVADTGNNRIQKFNEKGEFVATYGFGVSNGEEKLEACTTSCRAGNPGAGHGQFEKPRTLATDSAGNVWVTDTGNNRVEELNEKGEYVKVFGTAGTGNGQFNEPVGITIDSHSNTWVTDATNNRVEEFNEKGEYATQFGTTGSENGQFHEPWSIQVNTRNEIFVSDSANTRIQKLAPTGAPTNTTPPSISGELISGQTLNASTGTWNGAATLSYTYQWQDCNTTGEACTNITGATSATHVIGTADTGHTLRAIVTAANSSGSASATSPATELVGAARTSHFAYDANGNLESVTDPIGNKTKYTYDADNEQTKVEEPNKTTTETGYDGAGQVTSQTDGNKHTTKYVRNILEQVTESIDPKERKTTYEYDSSGRLKAMTDASKRTTSYARNPAGRIEEVTYSDGKTHAVGYQYNPDGYVTVMIDGTGTTHTAYDQLDRITATENGNNETVKYGYDLADEITTMTYPSGKAITQTYDKDGRLEKITDWLSHATKFGYDPNSNLTTTVFPSETGNEDKFVYDTTDRMSEVKMTKASELLASLTYGRNNDSQVEATTSKGLPGEEHASYEYDQNRRLSKASASAYEYDGANNLTKLGVSVLKYDAASEVESVGEAKYSYNEVGQRTKATPPSGPPTTYGYDQASNLIAVERASEAEIPQIEDAYSYNGTGLRVAEAQAGVTKHLAWDTNISVPLLLSDGANSYIYGPNSLPLEQINNISGAVFYLHHDQAGSTRLLTGSTGKTEGKCSYSPYGTPTCEGTTSTPLGYDAQYTSTDTGLVYLRRRTYDPATSQFLSRDPIDARTRAPYSYGEDDPLSWGDPTGESVLGTIGKILFPHGGSTQVCVGGTVSFGVTITAEGCYVQTPHGEGITITPSVGFGGGAAINAHAGIGESTACRPSEYGGFFSQAGGSAELGTGGYYNRFSSRPFSEVTGARPVEGWTAGGSVGVGAEAGGGISGTVVIPIGGESGGSSSGCEC